MISQNKIEDIKKYAELFFSISEIAILIDVDIDELREAIENKKSEISKAYHKAKLKKEVEIREQEIELASLGNNKAIEQVEKYISTQKLDE